MLSVTLENMKKMLIESGKNVIMMSDFNCGGEIGTIRGSRR